MAKKKTVKRKRKTPAAPVSASLPPQVRLATLLVMELRACELHDHDVGAASCLAAARYYSHGISTADRLTSIVLGHLLIEAARPLSELRVMLVEAAVKRAHDLWSA